MRKKPQEKVINPLISERVVKRSLVNDVRRWRFKRLLAVRRGCRGTLYDGPFDLEEEEDLRLYVRWFRVNYPAPEGLIAKSESFFGMSLNG